MKLDLEDGHCFEINPHFQDWLKEIYQACDQAVFLLIDYGMEERSYFSRSKNGYARAFYQHQVHDHLLQWPGLQDLTTHVNFTHIASAAYDIGWAMKGYTTQANFLVDCGIADLDLPPYDSEEGILARAQIKKLMLPQDMGEMFKVLALGKNMDIDLLGFQNEISNRL
jgi:SAM-dependent MidA family methyltransferase